MRGRIFTFLFMLIAAVLVACSGNEKEEYFSYQQRFEDSIDSYLVNGSDKELITTIDEFAEFIQDSDLDYTIKEKQLQSLSYYKTAIERENYDLINAASKLNYEAMNEIAAIN